MGKESFDAKEQLRLLIQRYDEDPVDIRGVLLDYIGRSGEDLFQVLDINPRLYKDLFNGSLAEVGEYLVRSLFDRDSAEAITLADKYRGKYPAASQLIENMKDEPNVMAKNEGDLIADPASYLSHDVQTTIWQISDIHFGKLNRHENDPRKLAHQLGRIAQEHPPLSPDILVFSGDLTSAASKPEFSKFIEFCKCLGELLWNKHYPERVLIVPGNHDVRWCRNGQADRMVRFIEMISNANIGITPFGPKKKTYAKGEVVVSRSDDEGGQVPQCARVTYREHDIEFLLLVSAYFSGVVPKEVRKLIGPSLSTRDELLEIMRLDEGQIDHDYLYHIAKMRANGDGLRLAVMHHHPVQYGTELCKNKYAPELLQMLWNNKIPIVLHGHVHLYEDSARKRPFDPDRAYPLPCTTLCSECVAHGKGMSIHLVGKDSSGLRHIDTLVWELSSDSSFDLTQLRHRYRVNVKDKALEISHLM